MHWPVSFQHISPILPLIFSTHLMLLEHAVAKGDTSVSVHLSLRHTCDHSAPLQFKLSKYISHLTIDNVSSFFTPDLMF